jgi:predicted acylesterase/phospholipase RssA
MLDGLIPASVTVSGTTAGALVAAQVAQLGTEAKLISDVSVLRTRMDYVEDDEEGDS